MARSSFGKLQRDRDKKAKAAAKRERRQNRGNDDGVEVSSEADQAPEDDGTSSEELLRMLAEVHEQFEANQISFDDFEERKAALMARISVD